MIYSILQIEYRHLREWLAVLKEERRQARLWPMVRALCTGRVSFRVWRRRMRTCARCPIYDRELRRCRGPVLNGVETGCGCYVVFLALTRRPYPLGCWGRQVVGPGFGWGAEER